MRELDTRALIFRGHGVIGRLFTSNPLVVALVTFGLALCCLLLPAWLLGLGHVYRNDCNHITDVGFFVKFNWSLVYLLLAPILISLGILGFRRMRDAVYQLIEDSEFRIPVIENKGGGVAYEYPDYLKNELARGAGWIEVVAAVTAIAITLVDTADLWPGYLNGGDFPKSRVPEWDTAWRIPTAQLHNPWPNFWFDVVAYTFQTALIFLGLIFLIKFWSFLRLIVQIIDQHRPPYQFTPWICDMHRRLGLRPLGWVFNLFLGVVVLYQAFGFYHRIELIDVFRHDPPNTYVKELWERVRPAEGAGLAKQVIAIFKLTFSDRGWAPLANPSTWIPLLFSLPPIMVVCLLPLGKLFWYLRREMALLTDRTNVELSRARDEQDEKRIEEMEKRLKCLRETTIWPNGSIAGSVFLILMIALLVGTACPPLLLWGIASGIVVKVVWWALGKSKKD